MSQPDALTGLPNRRNFNEALTAAVARGSSALLLVDIDWFGYVNFHQGHAIGDEYLIRCARTIKESANGKTVYRVGGNTFTVIVDDLHDAPNIAESVRVAIEKEFEETLQKPKLTASIGVSLIVGDERRSLSAAEKAMIKAKNDGRNRVMLGEDFPR